MAKKIIVSNDPKDKWKQQVDNFINGLVSNVPTNAAGWADATAQANFNALLQFLRDLSVK